MPLSSVRTRLVSRFAVLIPVAAMLLATLPLVGGADADQRVTDESVTQFLLVHVTDSSHIQMLEVAGYDVAEVNAADGGGWDLSVLASDGQAEALPGFARILDSAPAPTLEDLQDDLFGNVLVEPEEMQARVVAEAEMAAFAESTPSPAPVVEDRYIDVLRADWFANSVGIFISVEAHSEEGEDDILTVTANGEEFPMSRFRDAGQYMYHRFSSPERVVSPPAQVTVSNDDGESTTVPTREWTSGSVSPFPAGFEWGFTNEGYMDAVQTTEQIVDIAANYPDITELIDLPYLTNGYRRQAIAQTSGSSASQVLYLLSDAYGSEGGNDWTLVLENPGTPDASTSVAVTGTTITVTLATDGDSTATATAAEVVAALNANAAVQAMGEAFTYRSSEGTSPAIAGTYPLSDRLSAPDTISREPAQVKAIRIGAQRDGTRPGVMIYCQEHAREWVTPLVCVETAHRLTANYGTDAATTTLVDALDIFIVPTVNPDGTNYSIYDFNSQRKSMTNYCEPNNSDTGRWNSMGVDLNRNYRVGSAHDGYDGASTTSCTSGTYAGPAEGSEPEAQNEMWLAETFPNIEFAMNTHSHGGYFMWAPASYIQEGRVTLPRPTAGIEAYFEETAEDILRDIKSFRGTVIEPGRAGPVIDVLYSAAGNSADDHYYEYVDEETEVGRDPDIFAFNFEVGARIYDPIDDSWDSTGFQPPFAEEGFYQAMEFANGMYGLLEVVKAFGEDTQAPVTSTNISDTEWFEEPVDVTFDSDEPATIHYTIDGSVPTLDSPVIERRYIRDIPEPLTISEQTLLRWIAVDASGNQSRPQQVTVRFEPPPAPGPGPGPGPVTPTEEPTEEPTEGPDRVLSVTPGGVDEADPTDLSIEMSQLTNPSTRAFAQAADSAIIASDTVFADALASGTLQTDGRSLLLNEADELESAVLAELQRLGVEEVIVLGGTAAISEAVTDELEAEGFSVNRIAGETRTETATAIAESAADTDGLLLARAYPLDGSTDATQAFADSLAAGGWAAQAGTGLLLTQSDELNDSAATYLSSSSASDVTAIGGSAAIADIVLDAVEALDLGTNRVQGTNRFATAVAIAEARGFDEGNPAERVIVVEGQSAMSWVAGFTAAALSASTDAPILLANGDDLPTETMSFLESAFAPAESGTVVVCLAEQAACDAAEAVMES
ncbi:MAG: M14 family zinc carboxypeptidase [Actinomycetota bacterium]